jgi:hypothetical protein
MLFQIKTSKRGWINPADEPENWQGLCKEMMLYSYGDLHYKNNHLILWASSQTMWQKLHNLPNTSFQVNGLTPETVEVRYCYIHK